MPPSYSVLISLLLAQTELIYGLLIQVQPSDTSCGLVDCGNNLRHNLHHLHNSFLPAPPHRLNVPFTVLHSKSNVFDEESTIRSHRRPELLHRKVRLRRRRYTSDDQESHVTAAGAESLFSLTWWPFTYSTTTDTPPNENIDLQYIDALAIDCGWACISNTEQIQLKQMKHLLQSELKKIRGTKLHEKYPDVYSDLRLLRFLRKSKERDVTAAAERYRSFLQWREQNEVDKLRGMIEGPCSDWFTPSDESLKAVSTYFPINFDYLVQETSDLNEGDNAAAKPAILNVGEFNTRGITEKILAEDSDMALDDFLNYWIFLYEAIHLRLYQQSIQCGQMAFLDEVCDLSGLSLRQFSPSFVSKIMSPWLKMTQAYYPETTRRIYVLYPPAIIKVAWKLVTPLLSQGTIDKIRFVRKFNGSASDFVSSGAWLD